MNQSSRQNAKNSVEKDFLKLLSNANFGYDCRDNSDNCTFEAISNETVEISYIKRYYNFFDKPIYNFVKSNLHKAEVEKTYKEKLSKIEDARRKLLKEARIRFLKTGKLQNLDEAKFMKNHEKETHKKIALAITKLEVMKQIKILKIKISSTLIETIAAVLNLLPYKKVRI